MANDEAASPLLEVVRAFRPRILAEREQIESGRRLPVDLTRELAGAGFFRIFLPAAYGGLDLTPMEGMEVDEELARADASVAWCVWNGNVNWTTAQLSKEVAQRVFADPGMILANSTRPSGQAAVAGGEATMPARAQVRLASWHAVTSATQAVDLVYLTGGATSLYATCPLERAFRDVHAMTQHIAVHPRILETAGRVRFGLEPEVPLTV